MPVAAKQMLYVSGTNFLPVPGNYYYAGREGTYKLKTKLHNGQPKLWGDFHPTGSSNFKYSHYITVCAAQNSFDLVTQQIFSSMFTINENLDKCCRHGVGLSTVMNREPCRNVFNKMGSSIVAFGETICGIQDEWDDGVNLESCFIDKWPQKNMLEFVMKHNTDSLAL